MVGGLGRGIGGGFGHFFCLVVDEEVWRERRGFLVEFVGAVAVAVAVVVSCGLLVDGMLVVEL